MNPTTRTDDDRGQVGIGTLIVFISMVLVAAIAAGVLINTAGFLQTHAEATGEESTAQVSDNVQVVTDVGLTNASDRFGDDAWDGLDDEQENHIVHLELTVQKAPGADTIDMSATTIEYLNDEAETLTHNGTIPDNGSIDHVEKVSQEEPAFMLQEIRGESGHDVLMADDDRVMVSIPLGEEGVITGDHPYIEDSDTNQPGFVEPGDDVELRIVTPQGSQHEVVLRVPDIIRNQPAVDL